MKKQVINGFPTALTSYTYDTNQLSKCVSYEDFQPLEISKDLQSTQRIPPFLEPYPFKCSSKGGKNCL